MIRTVLADDEVLARQKLQQLLREIEDIEIVGEARTASETVELVRLTKPNLLLLDICICDSNGFDVLEELSSDPEAFVPHVIFVTAKDAYAVRALDIHAVDYLLKP